MANDVDCKIQQKTLLTQKYGDESPDTKRNVTAYWCKNFFFFKGQNRRLHPCYNSREAFVSARSKTVFTLIMKNDQ